MAEIPLMKCGHNGMAVNEKGEPVCPICAPQDPRAYQVDTNPPKMEGRRARCTYFGQPTRHNECNYGGDRDVVCHCEQPSSPDLPFFEYLGPDSPARLCMHCGFAIGAHQPETHRCPLRYTNMKPIPGSYNWAGYSYEPKDYQFDRFYCGCHSWD